MSPSFIFFKNELIGILGSPGGSRIICYVSKVAFEILFLKNDPFSAVSSPHYCSRNNFTELENNNISSDLKQYLQKKNHNIKYKDMTSGLNIIWKKINFGRELLILEEKDLQLAIRETNGSLIFF